MSQFLGPTAGQTGVGIQCSPDDIRHFPSYVIDMDPFVYARVAVGWDLWMGWETPWWPRGANLDASGGEWHQAITWDTPELIEPKGGGTNSRLAITGQCLDVYGTPVVGAIVKLFKTLNTPMPGKDVLFDEITSDANGNWLLYTPYYPDTHYIVEYKAGSGVPDSFGTSANTLTGS